MRRKYIAVHSEFTTSLDRFHHCRGVTFGSQANSFGAADACISARKRDLTSVVLLTRRTVALVGSPRAGQVLPGSLHPLLMRLLHDGIFVRRVLPDSIQPCVPFRRYLRSVKVPLRRSKMANLISAIPFAESIGSIRRVPEHSLRCVHGHCAMFQGELRSRCFRSDPARLFALQQRRCGCRDVSTASVPCTSYASAVAFRLPQDLTVKSEEAILADRLDEPLPRAERGHYARQTST